MEYKKISGITRQIAWSGLSDFITNSYTDDIQGLLKAIYSLIADVGIDCLTEEEIKRLRLFNYNLNYHIKPYLEGMKKKQIVEEDLSSEKFKNFKKSIGRCGLINLDCYIILYKLLKQTVLYNQSIHNNYIAESRKKYFLIKLEDQSEKMLYFRNLKKSEVNSNEDRQL